MLLRFGKTDDAEIALLVASQCALSGDPKIDRALFDIARQKSLRTTPRESGRNLPCARLGLSCAGDHRQAVESLEHSNQVAKTDADSTFPTVLNDFALALARQSLKEFDQARESLKRGIGESRRRGRLMAIRGGATDFAPARRRSRHRQAGVERTGGLRSARLVSIRRGDLKRRKPTLKSPRRFDRMIRACSR